jgi:coenzyme F420-0:L-glutamate ligase / coenzyme F420-1:gamma-L-glutamate ligase
LASLSINSLYLTQEILTGADLAADLLEAMRSSDLRVTAGDILVVAQKIISKAEGLTVDLRDVTPSPRALKLAEITRKDARLVELVLSESTDVLRAVPNVLIVRHHSGCVMANAGIDRSNVPNVDGEERVLLLPRDADKSAQQLHDAIAEKTGVNIGVIIADSFGRPWRIGVTHVALGAAGLPALIDRRGETDRHGRVLEVTQIAVADAVASAAGLVMGEAAESTPAALVRGYVTAAPDCPARALVRPLDQDLFR